MTCRGPAPILAARTGVALLVTLLAAAAVGGDEARLAEAARAFLVDRDASRLASALCDAPPPGPDGLTDCRMAALAVDGALRPSGAGGAGYAALPGVVGALRELDLESAGRLATALRGAPAGIDRWVEALLAVRRGQDAAAARALRAAVGPGAIGQEVAFRLALLGAALPVDDRLMLAAVGLEALAAAAADGDLPSADALARRLAALDASSGARALTWASRAWRRAGRRAEAGALLNGPEVAWTGAGLRLERALDLWWAGRIGEARLAATGLDLPPGEAWIAALLAALPEGAAPPPVLPSGVPHVQALGRTPELVARLATALGVPTSAAEIEAALLPPSAQGPSPVGRAESGAEDWIGVLAERGIAAFPVAGGTTALAGALQAGWPALLWQVTIEGGRIAERVVLVRGRDEATGAWLVEPADLAEQALLPPDAPRTARMLVAAPQVEVERLRALVPASEQALGGQIVRALAAARTGDGRQAAERLAPAPGDESGEAARAFYRGYLLYACFLATKDLPPIRQDRAALAQARDLLAPLRNPREAFPALVVGEALLADGALAEALVLFREARGAAPHSAFVARVLSEVILAAGGDGAAALESLDEARRLDPLDVAPLYQRGHRRRTLGQIDGARGDLLRARDRRPGTTVLTLELAALELDANQPERALLRIQELLRQDPAASGDEPLGAARRAAEGAIVQRAASVQALRPLVASPEAETRRRVAFALARFETDEAERLLRGFLEDAEEAVRVTALRVYMRPWLSGRVGRDAPLGERVVGLLHDDPSEMVRGAAAGLVSLVEADWSARELADALAGVRRDPAAYPRSEAASALVRLDGALARGALVRALADEDASVRRAAIDALFRIAATYRGYDPEDPESERAEAIRRWQAWLEGDGR